MEIPEQLMKYKFHAIAVAIFSILISVLIKFSPRFVDVISFFWPLLMSTAMFLVIVLVFSRISPLAVEAHGEKAGEGLLDYVAGQPDHLPPHHDVVSSHDDVVSSSHEKEESKKEE